MFRSSGKDRTETQEENLCGSAQNKTDRQEGNL